MGGSQAPRVLGASCPVTPAPAAHIAYLTITFPGSGPNNVAVTLVICDMRGTLFTAKDHFLEMYGVSVAIATKTPYICS